MAKKLIAKQWHDATIQNNFVFGKTMIDMDKLKRGQHYSKLGKSVIIFICPFDRFEYGLHLHSFSERCDQNPNIKLNHGATKIFLSTKGTVDDVSSGIVSGKFVEELDAAVDSVKSNEKERHDFMTFQMYLLEQEMEAEELATDNPKI